MTPLYRAWLALLQAQDQFDLTYPVLGDTWAVLDSQRTTVRLWMEEEDDEESV